VNQKLEQGPTEFLVVLKVQADLSTLAFEPKAKKRQDVVRALQTTAVATQSPVRAVVASQHAVLIRPFWIVNMILVRANAAQAAAIAGHPDVARLSANPRVPLRGSLGPPPLPDLFLVPPSFEWGIRQTHAEDVWTAGYTGQGVVVAGIDTGVRWTHKALKAQYRGWNGTAANHDYNWYDAIHSGGGPCEANTRAPCDDHGHGTHTMGTMVGSDGGTYEIGVAPGAKWIACRSMSQGVGTPASYSECFEWFMAPRRFGAEPLRGDPAKAPDVINNSWGCPPSEGCTDPTVLKKVVDNTRAAGIVVVVAAGNDGNKGCGGLDMAPAILESAFSVGATGEGDSIADFSSRGPVTADNSSRLKPNISAPGVFVRSSTNTSDTAYASDQGTSMASPHVAGAVALLLSAYPRLSVDAVETALEQSAVQQKTAQMCGLVSGDQVPNNTYGWGRLDALAAVKSLSADQNVSIQESGDPVQPGAPLTYTITVHNAGPANASNVTLVDTVPVGTEVGPVTPSQGNCGPVSTTVICDLGAIASGADATVTIVVTPPTEGTLTNSVVVRAVELDFAPDDNAASESTKVARGGPGYGGAR
jgi:uncharacterized repeat protein (TIGR01451 family)